jgi:hypothetical protein
MALWDDFLRVVTPRSEAEKQVDLIYGGQSPDTVSGLAVSGGEIDFAAQFTVPEIATQIEAPAELSLFDRILGAVTPTSHGEALVNAIYGGDTRGLTADPAYNIEDLSSPNVYVQTKGAIKDTVSALGSFAQNYAMVIGGFLVVLVILYAAVPALIRR